ncbi:unnamed protein product, partial [Vitis vinifera]
MTTAIYFIMTPTAIVIDQFRFDFWWVIWVRAKATSLPVYDKSVYDYDIFDGVPGLNISGSVNYDVFSTVRDRSRSKTMRMMIFLGVLGGRIWSRRDSKMSRMLGLDLMICFMGLVGLVFQVIGQQRMSIGHQNQLLMPLKQPPM